MQSSTRKPLIGHSGPAAQERTVKMKTTSHTAKSNRLLAAARGSRLIEKFSESLASRNVINRYSRYDNNIVNEPRFKRLAQETVQTANQSLRYNLDHNCYHHNHYHHHHNEQQQPQHYYHKNHQTSNKKQTRVKLLLSALFSRKQKNKASLLMSLLRAPVVLAALFSLLLLVTLMVLYAMSFHHNRLTVSQQQRHEVLPISSHHINSRHLQITNDSRLQDEPRKQSSQKAVKKAEKADKQPFERPYSTPTGFNRALTVQTECGSFVGVPEGRGIVFKGIPYASPPIGQRRWIRPRPVWLDTNLCRTNKTSQANEWRSHCAQLSPVTRRFTGHEDCLYLDIYSPQLDQVKKLPVMVYIHGGFLAYGSSGQGRVNWIKARPSAKLASELNIVIVTFNYRLQALGFMTLVQLAQNNGPDGSEGNYGLWDQLAALNWIKRNIESFGGDSNNIVLFGPDSASALPLALLSEGREMLFHERQSPDNNASHHEASWSASNAYQSLYSNDLFRAVWLTNPTVYYELPYELASKHYQRLFLNQSPCFNVSSFISSDQPTNESSSSSSQHPKGGHHDHDQQQQQSDQMLGCLMNLSAEQVVRLYLGKDDPSYRLDDQNSLPIHGIFADQFVTVDQELVQNSYPFSNSHYTTSKLAGLQHNSTDLNQQNQTPIARYNRANETHIRRRSSNYNDDNCVGLICARRGKDLLLGSTAQAVEYWPCPRDLHQWNWDSFKRYVATSLNTFALDTYKKASELYSVPSGELTNQSTDKNNSSGNSGYCGDGSSSSRSSKSSINTTINKMNPAETYLTMVSDIRQICPINELADNMRNRHHSVHRYIVETPPSSQETNLATIATVDDQQETTTEPTKQYRSHYAFHTWDLFAFLGFEFEWPEFKPNERDLKFQTQIRQMVKSFVRREPIDNTDGWYIVFGKDGAKRLVENHKLDECRMWHRHLGRTYAWVS